MSKQMQHNERHEKILDYLREHKTARVNELARLLFVSETTVRRELEAMQSLGLAERTHGGAILHESADEISVFVRAKANPKEKEKLATTAQALLPDFATLFLDSSTTALTLAGRLDLRRKTVVTDSLQAAMLLSKKSAITPVMLGGEVSYRSDSVTGSMTVRQLGEFRFDLMIASCAAVTEEGAFENSLGICEVKKAAFANSRKRILLADAGKFNRRGTYLLAPLDGFDFVVTDSKPPFVAENFRF